jgi:streptomycin 6-kinase
VATAPSEAAIAARWRFVPEGDPFETHSSWLRYGTHNGAPCVLKIYKPGSDEAPGARFLRAHEGCGVVRVLESESDAVLLERALPGTSLDTLCTQGRDDEATHILCDTIERMQSARSNAAGWPEIARKSTEFSRYKPAGRLTQAVIDRAAEMFRALCVSQRDPVLLHGDLHHENILRDDARGWLAIDPKGIVAELAYEFAAPLRNPGLLPVTPERLHARVEIICARFGLDRRRVLGWAFARNTLVAIWVRQNPQPYGDGFEQAALSALALLDDEFRI